MSYLHEFETQRPEQQDPIGIEIELPPTVDMVKQKRTATTTRSMKDRHRSHKHVSPPAETGEHSQSFSLSLFIIHRLFR